MFSYELYADVVDEDVKNQIVAIESAEIQLDRALAAYDAIMESQELALREADLRYFGESGDANALMDYYEDAAEKTDEKKKGILHTIWDRIIGFINKILGRTDKKDENENYAGDPETKTALQKVQEAAQAVLQFLTHPLKSLFTKGVSLWKKLVSALELITLGVAVYKGGKWIINKTKKKAPSGDGGSAESAGETTTTAIQISGKELNTEIGRCNGLLGKIVNAVKGNKDNYQKEVGSENEGIVSKIVSAIVEAIKKILAALKGAPKWIAGKVNETIDKHAGKLKKAVNDAAENAEKNLDNAGTELANATGKDQADMSSADDAIFGKDFADLLASEPYTESVDDDFGDMLEGLI